MAAEEEDKFLKYFDAYKHKFWKSVWNLGKNERHLIIDRRRAKRLFFRYAVWELKQSESALEAASQDPESIPGLKADLKLAEEKLQQVFDPRKLQSLSSEECLEQANALEPRADQVVMTFTKLKRKKEELTPKTPSLEKQMSHVEKQTPPVEKQLEVEEAPTDELAGNEVKRLPAGVAVNICVLKIIVSIVLINKSGTFAGIADSTPAPRKNARKPRPKKDAEEPTPTENTTATTRAVDVEILDATNVEAAQTEEPDEAEKTPNTKRPKKSRLSQKI
ncbi:hypothetical protein R1sor_006604 [Riccia sorocarpa]|uniref:Uncharacterized protein n=1 Tax=Riccia sorocarpa TaxID=122646 RepID=A0ABD3HNI4_9MARC